MSGPPQEDDNSEAQFYLGHFYQHGVGVEKNAGNALDWYRRSATGGYPRAQNKMGMIYYSGSGAEQDHASAVKWFTHSAKAGDDQAQYMLGKIYSAGRGVEPDTSKAIRWLKRASPADTLIRNTSWGNCSMRPQRTRKTLKTRITGPKKASIRAWDTRKNSCEKLKKTGRSTL
ncbi:MAG: tetratricopeptide repeat protein [Candidatus Marinimicrobia bacterium]|nr:tetratricopeptide repeat protein [Candidatus Neomarinimicrobiota bacterium]